MVMIMVKSKLETIIALGFTAATLWLFANSGSAHKNLYLAKYSKQT